MYCKVKKDSLDGCCLACEIPTEKATSNLTQRLQFSIKDQYTVGIYILTLVKSICIHI